MNLFAKVSTSPRLLHLLYILIFLPCLQDCKRVAKTSALPISKPPELERENLDLSDSPTTYAEMADHINSLPKPLSLADFVSSLPRPLNILATNSSFSAQPAVGSRSPRFFIFNDRLVTSVVPAGSGRHSAEFSLLTANGQSIKAEIEFPIYENVSAQTLFNNIVRTDGPGTQCRFCHSRETPVSIDGDFAFESVAILPVPSTFVSIDFLRQESANCDPQVEPERCALLNAIFSGDVQFQDFPD